MTYSHTEYKHLISAQVFVPGNEHIDLTSDARQQEQKSDIEFRGNNSFQKFLLVGQQKKCCSYAG